MSGVAGVIVSGFIARAICEGEGLGRTDGVRDGFRAESVLPIAGAARGIQRAMRAARSGCTSRVPACSAGRPEGANNSRSSAKWPDIATTQLMLRDGEKGIRESGCAVFCRSHMRTSVISLMT